MKLKKSPKQPRLHLRRGEKISKGLKTLATLQMEAAIEELRGNNVAPEPVHNARTSIKKVRSIVQLAAPALGRVRRDYLLDLLHDAATRLGPLRDSEIQVQSLDLALESAHQPVEIFASLRNGLADIAKQRRMNDSRQVPRVIGFLEKILKNIPEWPLEPLGSKDIRRRIRRTYRRGRTTLEVCHESGNQELFHTWRKLVKQLGHQLIVSSKYWPDHAEGHLATIEKIGDLAGRERDFSQLIETMKHGPKTRPSEQAIEIIEGLIPPLRKKALELGGLFYDPKPKAFIDPLDL